MRSDEHDLNGTASDSKTGEGLSKKLPRRLRRSPKEEAEAARVREERAELRRQELAAFRFLDPACQTSEEPPIVWRKPQRMGGEPSGLLLDLARVSGRGLPGSHLVLAARYYDGAGPNGGEPHHAVTAHVIFRDGAGHKRRTVGVAIHQAELRAVGLALLAEADRLDANGTPIAKGHDL